MRALIVDSGEGRGSLAAARALAQAGWTVGIGCPRSWGSIGVSRHVRHRHALRPLAAGAADFVQAVARILEERDYDLVFPSSDGELIALSQERDRLAGALPYADHETVLSAIGKHSLMEAAARVGLRTPPTFASAAEAHARWGSRPVIVKEDRHGTFGADERFTHIAPAKLEGLAAAERRVREIRARGGEPLVQPLIEGQLMAFTSVIDGRGDLLARVQQVTERLYPCGAGLSARAHTTGVDEKLARLARALLRELRWFGLSELQFILPTTGEPALLDLNGRFYGSLALALAAGVNLPDIWGRAALGLATALAKDARPGVRYHWLEGDLRAARKSSASTLREVAGALGYARRSKASIWSASDPLPGICVALGLIKQVIARRRRRRRAGGAP